MYEIGQCCCPGRSIHAVLSVHVHECTHMCTHTHIHVHACTHTHTHTHTHTYTERLGLYHLQRLSVHISHTVFTKRTCAQMYTPVCTHIHAHTHTHTHTHTDWACTNCSDFGFLFFILFLQSVHVHESTHMCTHTHAHKHTHTLTDWACTTCSDFGFLFLTIFTNHYMCMNVHTCVHTHSHTHTHTPTGLVPLAVTLGSHYSHCFH